MSIVAPISTSCAKHAAIRLRATVSHLTRQLRAQASPEGPGAAKLGVLGQLYRIGPLTSTQLALCERVRLQTLTRLIAELETEKLIARRPHARDARQSMLSLTAAGVRVLTADIHRREASLGAAIAVQLRPAECATVLEACTLIDRLANAIALESRREPELRPEPHSSRRAKARKKAAA